MPKVMIVDDAAFMRMMLRNILANTDFEVVGEASTGTQAVRLYQELHPDVVTMDITMPDKDGVSAVREIRKIDPGAKIIMCSAMGQQEMIVDSIKAGASDFLVKPFQPERVLESLRKILGISAQKTEEES
ncbi:MAG: response regulator [Negativicutes bacterium]|nr:response regulator [Negativicutes bacterium]